MNNFVRENKRGTYNRYPDEFKKDAISLILEQGYTPQQTAEAVGVDVKLIYNWKNKIESQDNHDSLGALSQKYFCSIEGFILGEFMPPVRRIVQK